MNKGQREVQKREQQAKDRHYGGERARAYVYKGMAKDGAKKAAKGK